MQKLQIEFDNFESALYVVWRDREHGLWRSVTFTAPLPPSLNDWVRVFRGKAHKSPLAELYMTELSNLLRNHPLAVEPTANKLICDVRLFGLPTGSDVDARTKQLFDAVQHGILCYNDYQFKKLIVEDMETDSNPHIEVCIEQRL